MLELECQLLHAERPASEASRGGILARLAASADSREPALPLNLAVILDLGGAMEGDPLDAAREGIARLCTTLRRGDRVLLIGAERRPRRLLGWREAADGARIADALRRVRAGEGCDLDAAFADACRELDASPEPCFRRVAAISGSPAMAGQRHANGHAGAAPHPVTALGLGECCDATRLAELAASSGGRFRYVADPRAASDELERLGARYAGLRCLAARIDVRPLARTTCASTMRQLGDLLPGEVAEAWLPLGFEPRPAGRFVIAEVTARADDRAFGSASTLSAAPEVDFSDSSVGSPPDADCEAAQLADSARALLTAGRPDRERLGLAAALLERAGRSRAADAVRAQLGRPTESPNPALTAIVSDLAVGTDFTG